ncbi:hypothetical protein V1509DRAFT_618109 [Lipomyces kononenkoae]
MANVRTPQLSFAQSYKLMTVARTKLSRAANTSDHDLRVLVSHANFLDALMIHLEHKDAPVASARRRTLARDREEEYRYFSHSDDEDSYSDDDSDSDSDCSSDDEDEDEEEYLVVTSNGRTLSPIPERSRETSDREDDDDDDDDADSMEPLHELRSQLYASGSESRRSVTFLPSLVDERTPRDSRHVQFSVHEIHREVVKSDNLGDRQAGYFADDDDDGQYAADEDDDMTFYEAANKHKHGSTENDPDDDMPLLTRLKPSVASRHVLLADNQPDQELAVPQLTDTTSTSDDDDDLDDIIPIRDNSSSRSNGSVSRGVPTSNPVSGHSIKEMTMFPGLRTQMSWVAY